MFCFYHDLLITVIFLIEIINRGFLLFILLFFSVLSIADDKPVILYRIDNRTPDLVFNNGISSWGWNENVVDHIDGTSIEDRSSIYVSTTESMNVINRMALSFIRGNSANDYWVYEIRPTSNFYSIFNSIAQAISSTNDDDLRTNYISLRDTIAWEREWAAVRHILYDQVISARSIHLNANNQIVLGERRYNLAYREATPVVSDRVLNLGGHRFGYVHILRTIMHFMAITFSFVDFSCRSPRAQIDDICNVTMISPAEREKRSRALSESISIFNQVSL